MTILLPTADILIQKAGEVTAAGYADFMVLPVADQVNNKLGLVSRCEVEFATTKEGTASAITFEVANLHPTTVRAMAQAGFVKIRAGYVQHPTRPVKPIFFGRLDKAVYRLESGRILWTFTATAFPNEIWGIKPNASLPFDANGKPVPIFVGEAVRILADRVGIGRANVRMPKIFDGDLTDTQVAAATDSAKVTQTFLNAITLEQWVTTSTAIDELVDLMAIVTNAVKNTFGVVRNYSLLTDVNDPFRIVIGDIGAYSGEFLNIDLDSSLILSAGPQESNVTVPPLTPLTDEADTSGQPEPPALPQVISEYQITSVFDPKVDMGILIRGKSAKLSLTATFQVTRGKHYLNGSPLKWRTEYAGPLQADIQVPRA